MLHINKLMNSLHQKYPNKKISIDKFNKIIDNICDIHLDNNEISMLKINKLMNSIYNIYFENENPVKKKYIRKYY